MSEIVYRPKTRNITIQRLDEQNSEMFIVADDTKFHFILIKRHGVHLLNAMDGRNTPEELQIRLYDTQRIKLSHEQIRAFLDMAARNNLVEDGTWSNTWSDTVRRKFKRILIPAEPIARWMQQHRAVLVNWVTISMASISILFGLLTFFAPQWVLPATVTVQPSLTLLITLFPLLFIQIVLHELGHLFACSYFGVQSKGFGYGLIWRFLPIIFTDTSRAYLLPNRYQRAMISLAGPLVDLAILGFVAILLQVISPTSASYGVLSAYVPLVSLLVVLNLNPLLVNFDGYWILVDLLGKPNLYRNSRAYFRAKVFGLFGRVSRKDKLIVQAQVKNEKRAGLIFAGYFVASTIATAIFLVLMVTSVIRLLGSA